MSVKTFHISVSVLNVNLVFDDAKIPSLLALEEAGTDTVSPVLREYGLVCVTRGTKLRSRWEEITSLEKCYARILPPPWGSEIKPGFFSASS